MGAEVVRRLTIGAEVDGLVPPDAVPGAGDCVRRAIVEEDLHVRGTARAVDLGPNPSGLELIGAALPLVPLLVVAVPRGAGGDLETTAVAGADRGPLREPVARGGGFRQDRPAGGPRRRVSQPFPSEDHGHGTPPQDRRRRRRDTGARSGFETRRISGGGASPLLWETSMGSKVGGPFG